MERLLLRLKGGDSDGYNKELQAKVVAEFEEFILYGYYFVEIWDYRSHEESIKDSESVYHYYSIFIIITKLLLLFS